MENLDRLKDDIVFNDDLEKIKVINPLSINEEIEKFKKIKNKIYNKKKKI